jgi:hypothetical protein
MMDDSKLALVRSRIAVLEAGARLCFVSARIMHHEPAESPPPRKGRARPGPRKSKQVPTDEFTLEMFEGGILEGPTPIMTNAADQINSELAQWTSERHCEAVKNARHLLTDGSGLKAIKRAQESVYEAQAYASFRFEIRPGSGEGRSFLMPYQNRIPLSLRGPEEARIDLTNHLNGIVAKVVAPVLDSIRAEIIGMLNDGPAHAPA